MNKSLKKLLKIIFLAVEISLTLRFILKIFSFDPEIGFVQLIYQNTEGLVLPFSVVFPSPSVSGKFVLEFTTLFAIFTYAFINYLIQEVLDFLSTKKK